MTGYIIDAPLHTPTILSQYTDPPFSINTVLHVLYMNDVKLTYLINVRE